jgi:hypothetical protein
VNLKQFINIRQYCPICETQLVTTFHSDRRQTIKVEEYRFQVFFALDGLKPGQKPYGMSYSFGLEHFDFHVEFYTKDKATRFETAHDFLRNRFLELHKNLKNFKFVRDCSFCERYACSTHQFPLDLKTTRYPELEIANEDFGLIHPTKDGHRIYKLSNKYPENRSSLTFWKGQPSEARISQHTPPKWRDATNLQLPLIPFISKEETTSRLNNLLIFT